MDKRRAIWDARYTKVIRGERALEGDPWLEPWLDVAPLGNPRRALDVGCGCGHNAKLLSDRGFEVTAIDISDVAVALCRREAPKALVHWADVRDGLLFPVDSFQLIVADLSLHYFPWDTTMAIIRDVANCLVDNGLFAGRFNSTRDVNHGAGVAEPVHGEPNLFIVGEIEKRFFTRECFGKLFVAPWRLLALGEKATTRFGSRKILWEVVTTKGARTLAEPSRPADADKPHG